MKHLKTLAKVLLINGILLLGLLYIFEFFFSPYADMPKNGVMLNGDEYSWGHKISRNSLGYREDEISSPKPDDVLRVMVLGDSLTYGMGLKVEERYSDIAEKKLLELLPEKKVEVLNFGISGHPTITERDELYQHYKSVQPDLIVVGFCINDTQPMEQNWSVEREKYKNAPVGKLVTFLGKGFSRVGLKYTASLISNLYYQPLINSGKIPEWQVALQRTYEPDSKEWQDFTQALADIKKLSDQLDLPSPIFAVLNQGTYSDKPTYYSKPDEYLKQFLRWYDQVENTADSLGFNAYNHKAEIIEQIDDEILAVNQFDGHPSASLNRIYGEKLAEKIVESLQNR